MKKRVMSGLMALLLLAGIASGCAGAPAAGEPQAGDLVELGGLIDESARPPSAR